jgi:hypothetical protein
MLKRMFLGLAALFFVVGLQAVAPAAHAANSQNVGVCDPQFPANCVKPNSDGSINIVGGALGTVTVTNPFNLEATQLSVKGDLDSLVTAAGNPAAIFGADGSTKMSGSNPLNVEGGSAQGATDNDVPLNGGCMGVSSTTAVTTGQKTNILCGLEGKQVVLPYTIKENAVRGSTGATTTNTQVSIIASAGGGVKNYITGIQCANSGASTSILTFTDSATTILINPAGSGVIATFPVPLATAAATAFQVTFGTASTSQYCSAQGYTGP